jgi:hypothetical protein
MEASKGVSISKYIRLLRGACYVQIELPFLDSPTPLLMGKLRKQKRNEMPPLLTTLSSIAPNFLLHAHTIPTIIFFASSALQPASH